MKWGIPEGSILDIIKGVLGVEIMAHTYLERVKGVGLSVTPNPRPSTINPANAFRMLVQTMSMTAGS